MTLLYSRYQDGAVPVTISSDPDKGGRSTYTLRHPQGPMTFQSARQLLIALTGHPEARHWTFDRYFHTGRFASAVPSLGKSVIEMLGGRAPTGITVTPFEPIRGRRVATATRVPVAGNEPALTVLELFPVGLPRVDERLVVDPGVPLGIDLAERGHEVAKLLFAGFGRKIHSAQYDPDDVLQEVFKGLLIRNKGRCPFNPRKASFGHYVHMVCLCVLSNYHRKQSRRRSKEQIGTLGWGPRSNGGPVSVDVASGGALLPSYAPLMANDRQAIDDLARYIQDNWGGRSSDSRLAVEILPLVSAGFGRSEIADLIGAKKLAVSRALKTIRVVTAAWKASMG